MALSDKENQLLLDATRDSFHKAATAHIRKRGGYVYGRGRRLPVCLVIDGGGSPELMFFSMAEMIVSRLLESWSARFTIPFFSAIGFEEIGSSGTWEAMPLAELDQNMAPDFLKRERIPCSYPFQAATAMAEGQVSLVTSGGSRDLKPLLFFLGGREPKFDRDYQYYDLVRNDFFRSSWGQAGTFVIGDPPCWAPSGIVPGSMEHQLFHGESSRWANQPWYEEEWYKNYENDLKHWCERMLGFPASHTVRPPEGSLRWFVGELVGKSLGWFS
jgi:hypothetical protein